jgi:hypothetical protein
MECVVRTWLFGTISDNLADTVSEHHASGRKIWLTSKDWLSTLTLIGLAA